MTVFCKQIDHSTLSLAEREERLASFETEAGAGLPGRVTLRTCNRVEVYGGDGDVPYDVMRHLFRVSSGLESQLIGERAVGGQVRDAYMAAKEAELPSVLHKLFEAAIRTGKRVRSETMLSHGAVSHSLAAVEIMEKEVGNLRGARIAIIGVNKLTTDILKFLQNKGATMVQLANRSEQKAHALGDPLGIKVRPLSEKRDLLTESDILISATSAPHLIIQPDDIAEGERLIAIDLAFPRDIDPSLRLREGLTLYDLDDIAVTIGRNIEVRQSEVAKAEAIIEEEIKKLSASIERMRTRSTRKI